MKNSECSISNIYRLDGRVPLLKAVPFGLQHILAMFVSNLTPMDALNTIYRLQNKLKNRWK